MAIERESEEDVWIVKTKSGKGLIVEVRRRYVISVDAIRELVKGNKKAVKMRLLRSEQQQSKPTEAKKKEETLF